MKTPRTFFRLIGLSGFLLAASHLSPYASLAGAFEDQALDLGLDPKTVQKRAEAIARDNPDFYRWYLAQPKADVQIKANHTFGAADAPITIVEFSDFESALCARLHQDIQGLLHGSDRKVRVVFHHFPLDSECNSKVTGRLHPQACLAAIAAECAGEQGKFWEYDNLLFEKHRKLGRKFLISYATRLGLKQNRFALCLASKDACRRVKRDAEAGAQLGIDSVPTTFINGRAIKGALAPGLLQDAIVLALSSENRRDRTGAQGGFPTQQYEATFSKLGCPTCEDLRRFKADYLEYVKHRGCDTSPCAGADARADAEAPPRGLSLKVLSSTSSCKAEGLPAIEGCTWLCVEVEISSGPTNNSDTALTIAAPSRRHRASGAKILLGRADFANVALIRVLSGPNSEGVQGAALIPSGTRADTKCSGMTIGYWVPTEIGDSYVDLTSLPSGQQLDIQDFGDPQRFHGGGFVTGITIRFAQHQAQSNRLLLVFPVRSGATAEDLELEGLPKSSLRR
jgi:protein-disulfide isomerase